MKTLAITANENGLIVHEFEDEDHALDKMPYIKRWERDAKTWAPENIRYHSKEANKYWSNRKLNDPIHGTRIIHIKEKVVYEYY